MTRIASDAGRRRPVRGRRTVTATEAAKNFGRLVDAVREARAEYVVERDGHPVVRISPAALDECRVRDLLELLQDLASPDPALGRAVASARASGNRPAPPRSPWDS